MVILYNVYKFCFAYNNHQILNCTFTFSKHNTVKVKIKTETLYLVLESLNSLYFINKLIPILWTVKILRQINGHVSISRL